MAEALHRPAAERARRAVVTLAALGAWKALGAVSAAAAADPAVVDTRLDFLGIMPWITASILVALAEVVLPERWRTRGVALAGDRRLGRRIDRVGLAVAALQAFAAAVAVELGVLDAGGMPPSRALLVTHFVGGTVLIRVLAEVIDRHGLGRGFPLLFAIGTITPSVLRSEALSVQFGARTLLDALLPFALAGLTAAWVARHEPRRWPAAPALPAGLTAASSAIGAKRALTTLPSLFPAAPTLPASGLGLVFGAAEAAVLAAVWFNPTKVERAATAVGLGAGSQIGRPRLRGRSSWRLCLRPATGGAAGPPSAGAPLRRTELRTRERAEPARAATPGVATPADPTVDREARAGIARSVLAVALAIPMMWLESRAAYATMVVLLAPAALVGVDLAREWRARQEALAPVARIERAWELTVALAALDAAGIRAHPQGALFRAVTPWGWCLAPVEVLVPVADVDRAAQVLAPLAPGEAAAARAAEARGGTAESATPGQPSPNA